jgi:hypothetical protein
MYRMCDCMRANRTGVGLIDLPLTKASVLFPLNPSSFNNGYGSFMPVLFTLVLSPACLCLFSSLLRKPSSQKMNGIVDWKKWPSLKREHVYSLSLIL